MLERMDDFFTARVDGYDEHMRQYVEEDSKFYAYTASLLPKEEGAEVLDLGCGTGLELEAYFDINPAAKVTGIDLTEAMLKALKDKFPDKAITTVCGSYFDVPFGKEAFNAAVSVESLHHFSEEEKLPLYKKLWEALKPGGYFVLTENNKYRFLSPQRDNLITTVLSICSGEGFCYDSLCKAPLVTKNRLHERIMT